MSLLKPGKKVLEKVLGLTALSKNKSKFTATPNGDAEQRKLGLRLLALILMFSSVLTCTLTIVQLATEYQREMHAIDASLLEIERSRLKTIIETVWLMDYALLKPSLDGLVSSEYISYSAFYNEYGKLLVESGTFRKGAIVKTSELPLVRSEPLTKSLINLGKIVIQADLEPVYDRLKRQLLNILVAQTFKTFLTSIFILYIFYRLVTRHLYTIRDFIQYEMRFYDFSHKQLALERDSGQDELQVIVDSINSMQHDLSSNFELLKQENNRRLEAEQAIRGYADDLVQIIDSITEAILVVDISGRLLLINHTGLELLGCAGQYKAAHKRLLLQNLITLSVGSDMRGVDIQALWMDCKRADKPYTFSGFCSINALTTEPMFPVSLTLVPVNFAAGGLQDDGTKNIMLLIKDESSSARLKEISYNATHDYLTGMHNRMAFDTHLAKILQQAEASPAHISLAIIDLDKFKQINDIGGHLAGDRVLQNVASIIHEIAGPQDFSARLGGDEFAIIFRQPLHKSYKLAAMIINRLEELKFIYKQQDLGISASIGLTAVYPGVDLPEKIYSRADQACYSAKHLGGGCIITEERKEKVYG